MALDIDSCTHDSYGLDSGDLPQKDRKFLIPRSLPVGTFFATTRSEYHIRAIAMSSGGLFAPFHDFMLV